MSETQQVRGNASDRKLVLITHALILAGQFTAQLTAVGAVIIAYTQRDRVGETIWETHYAAAITTFWIGLAFYLVSIPLMFVVISFANIVIPIAIVMTIWFLYRSIRGLVHAIESKPY